jgi:hypothetical protein
MTHLSVELGDDLVVSTVLYVCLAFSTEREVLGWWSITVSESGVVDTRVGEETVKNLQVSSDQDIAMKMVALFGRGTTDR